MLKINPELVSNKPTHEYNGEYVKVFTQTGENVVTGEFITGPHKGKWTTIFMENAKPLSTCYNCDNYTTNEKIGYKVFCSNRCVSQKYGV